MVNLNVFASCCQISHLIAKLIAIIQLNHSIECLDQLYNKLFTGFDARQRIENAFNDAYFIFMSCAEEIERNKSES